MDRLTNVPPSPVLPRAADRLALAAFDLIERRIIHTRTPLSDALEQYADERFGVMDGSGIQRLREALSSYHEP